MHALVLPFSLTIDCFLRTETKQETAVSPKNLLNPTVHENLETVTTIIEMLLRMFATPSEKPVYVQSRYIYQRARV